MGKVGKKKRSDAKKEVKKRKKLANYLRCGPKVGFSSQKKCKYGTHKGRKPNPDAELSPTPPGVTARRKRKGLQLEGDNKGNSVRPRYPLVPLRKRLHLSAQGIHKRREENKLLGLG